MNTDSIRITELESENYASPTIDVLGTSGGMIDISTLEAEDTGYFSADHIGIAPR